MHIRKSPVIHQFRYPVYFFQIDLDDLEAFANSRSQTPLLFGVNRYAVASIWERDYAVGFEGTSLRERLYSFLQHEGIDPSLVKRISLVTGARFFNYAFNPVSFYYFFGENNEVVAHLAEVNNTFGERHYYFIAETSAPSLSTNEVSTRSRGLVQPRVFHVSPFYDLQGDYRFSFSKFESDIEVKIEILSNNQSLFYSHIRGKAYPLNFKNLFKTFVRFPFTAFLTMPRILWQAARLHYEKRLKVYSKPIAHHDKTVQVKSPTLLQKLAMKVVLRFLNSLKGAALRLRLPSHEVLTVGDLEADSFLELDIHSYDFFWLCACRGDVGLGEAYVQGLFDIEHLSDLLALFVQNFNRIDDRSLVSTWLSHRILSFQHFLKRNTSSQMKKNIHDHYDLGNDLFRLFLDKTMTYSAAFFRRPDASLEEAQIEKYDRLIERAQIQPGDHVLEIGSGWGGFAIRAAETKDCRVTSLTLSRDQLAYAQQRAQEKGLENKVRFVFCDFRDFLKDENSRKPFDAIVSIEMIEAIGHEHLEHFFKICDQLLKPTGSLVLQAITIADQRYDSYRKNPDWIQHYIFPGAVVPSLSALVESAQRGSSFLLDSTQNIGEHYAKTLKLWDEQFLQVQTKVKDLGFGESFVRQWHYYFSYCEAGFRSKVLNTHQMVWKRPIKV